MARPRTISDEQLLSAARAVFLEQGFSAATAEIARRAGVSEGTLFKRFTTKEQLFAAATGCAFPAEAAWQQQLLAYAGQGDTRASLRAAVTEVLHFLQAHLPMMVVRWSNRVHLSDDALASAIESDAPPFQAIRALTPYLAAEMDLGRIRRADPSISARMLVGALMSFAFMNMARGAPASPAASALPHSGLDPFLDALLDTFWNGLAPPPAP